MRKSISSKATMKHETAGSIGVDLGDRTSDYVIFGLTGEPVECGKVATTAPALQELLGRVGPTVVAIEVGTHSAWVSRLIETSGHRVLVANPRKVALINRNKRKNNRIDAELLGRLARLDPKLLFPVQHRSEQAQSDLAVLRSRDAMMRCRTRLINHVRGASKAVGKQLSRCSAEAFAKRCMSELPGAVVEALRPLVQQIAAMTKTIVEYDRQIEAMADRYPAVAKLREVKGVGPLTATSYVLTLDDPSRFRRSRAVGPYLGLVPGTDDTGDTHVQRRITREGDVFLRRMVVSAAQYILGPFGEDCDLRRYGAAIAARGGKNGKKRAVVAVARKLAVLLHRLWVGSEKYDRFYQSKNDQVAA